MWYIEISIRLVDVKSTYIWLVLWAPKIVECVLFQNGAESYSKGCKSFRARLVTAAEVGHWGSHVWNPFIQKGWSNVHILAFEDAETKDGVKFGVSFVTKRDPETRSLNFCRCGCRRVMLNSSISRQTNVPFGIHVGHHIVRGQKGTYNKSLTT